MNIIHKRALERIILWYGEPKSDTHLLNQLAHYYKLMGFKDYLDYAQESYEVIKNEDITRPI